MEIGDVMENPAFWILTAVGVGAFVMMLTILKRMGNSDLMPLWVKIVTILVIPIAAAVFSGWAGGD